MNKSIKALFTSRLPRLKTHFGLLSLLLAACVPLPNSLSPGGSLKVRVSFSQDFQTQTFVQPAYSHRALDIRSTRIEIYSCTTQAAAQSNDPAAQAACSLVRNSDNNHYAGLSGLEFSLSDLIQSRRYTIKVSAYSGLDQGGTLMGTAWPLQNAGLREHVQTDSAGLLSVINDLAPLEQLDLSMQLSNTSQGGTVTGNSIAVVEGAAVISGSPAISVPVVPEFRVNATITDQQDFQAISMRDTGDFVITWQSNLQDGSFEGIYAQPFGAAGSRLGNEFRVNSFTNSRQRNPALALGRSNGEFVISWNSNAQDGSLEGVYAQRYNSAGVAQGAEFRVNTTTASSQRLPTVGLRSNGDFVIAWDSNPQDGDANGIYAQRYNAAGTAQGTEFRANTFTTSAQHSPQIAVQDAGAFVLIWPGNGQDNGISGGSGVFGQRYNAAGVAQGTEFRVNTTVLVNQDHPSVAIDDLGRFVVTWDSQDSNLLGVFAQPYNAAGVPQGTEHRVNTHQTGHQRNPSIAMNSSGDYVIAWESDGQDGSQLGIYAQRYNAAGVAQGPEFQVNANTTGNQQTPKVAMADNGSFVISFLAQDGDLLGVFARRFDALGNPL